MKSTLYIFIFSLVTFSSFAQGEKTKAAESTTYTIVEQMPEFPGGMQAARSYLGQAMKYPAEAKAKCLGGKAILKFVVDPNGEVSSVSVVKSSGVDILDDEAVRVVSSMPAWSPGKVDGVPVHVYYNLPISFSMDSPYFLINPNNSSTAYKKGCDAIKRGDAKSAKEMYLMVDGDVDAWFNLGVIYYNEKNFDTSSEYFNRVLSSGSDKSGYCYTMSDRFLKNYFKSK